MYISTKYESIIMTTEIKIGSKYSVSESLSKTELEQHIAKLEHQLNEINEHGLGDSDTALTKWTIERDLKIFKSALNRR